VARYDVFVTANYKTTVASVFGNFNIARIMQGV